MDYQGIIDLVTGNFDRNEAIGRAFILPSSFEGSDRAMKQHYFDALELTGRFGKADSFITFTSNPNWPELQQTLANGQPYLSRPDMCSRIYNLKFREYWNDLITEHKIGVVEAHFRVKEYQKRGLPHDHILLWMSENDKPSTAELIDQIICAEIPDPDVDRELFELVKTKMVHGPFLPNSSCMKQFGNRCSKGFPKEYNDRTIIRVNNYPLYRRRNNGRSVIVRGHDFDNRYVIPYDPVMLKKFQCHINVKYCGSLSSMKYKFNYVCKGNDRVNIQVHGLNNNMPFANRGILQEELNEINQHKDLIEQNEYIENDNYDVQMNRNIENNLVNNEMNHEENIGYNVPNDNENAQFIDNNRINLAPDVVENDDNAQVRNNDQNIAKVYDEIRTYERKRYVSSIETFDKIIGFKRHEISHTIIHLLIHLENRQNVVFTRVNIDRLANTVPRTMLTDFFDLNVRDQNANQFLYSEIVNHYRFDPNTKRWIERVQVKRANGIIGRIPFIHPNNRELFHLKLLLLHIRGPISYEFLKTFKGHVYETFEEAARDRNLIENNKQWNNLMDEICRVELPFRIRFD